MRRGTSTPTYWRTWSAWARSSGDGALRRGGGRIGLRRRGPRAPARRGGALGARARARAPLRAGGLSARRERRRRVVLAPPRAAEGTRPLRAPILLGARRGGRERGRRRLPRLRQHPRSAGSGGVRRPALAEGRAPPGARSLVRPGEGAPAPGAGTRCAPPAEARGLPRGRSLSRPRGVRPGPGGGLGALRPHRRVRVRLPARRQTNHRPHLSPGCGAAGRPPADGRGGTPRRAGGGRLPGSLRGPRDRAPRDGDGQARRALRGHPRQQRDPAAEPRGRYACEALRAPRPRLLGERRLPRLDPRRRARPRAGDRPRRHHRDALLRRRARLHPRRAHLQPTGDGRAGGARSAERALAARPGACLGAARPARALPVRPRPADAAPPAPRSPPRATQGA